jgi:hypothetical protein
MESGNIKEVQMDVTASGGGRTKRRGRKTRKAAADVSGTENVSVEKAPGPASAAPEKAPAKAPVAPAPVALAIAVPLKPTVAPQKVVLAPPKKKPTRILLVPSTAVAGAVKKPAVQKKIFTARRVRVLIDNTAKTQKRRRQTLQRVDALTDEQVRQACLESKLSRKETVAKVPIELLRQMLKDYQTMRGNLL